MRSQLENRMEMILTANGLLGYARDYRFLPRRKFELDFAWPQYKVAIEVQGGQYVRGAHLRPVRYHSDTEKLNEAQLAGWIVLWFTTEDVQKLVRKTVETVRRALALRKGEKCSEF